MRIHRQLARLALALTALPFAACTAETDTAAEPPPLGTIEAALSFVGPVHDVAAMHVTIATSADCSGDGVANVVVALEGEMLPPWLTSPDPAGDAHPFADALFVLPPGDYWVCAAPLDLAGLPSADCAGVDAYGPVSVLAELTAEITLFAACEGETTGGLDTVMALNDPPRINDFHITPSKFVGSCDEQVFVVEASDPNDDVMAFTWEVVTTPQAAVFWIHTDGPLLSLRACTPGTYQLRVTVSELHGRITSLTVPAHISGEPGGCCAVPGATGCTLTQGYWKSHNSEAPPGPRQVDWPPPQDEATAICSETWLSCLKSQPGVNDKWTILAHQWIAARLNVANGASTTPLVDACVEDGGLLLRDYCDGIPPLHEAAATALATVLDDYNNGLIGPGHCE